MPLPIANLSKSILHNPVKIEVAPVASVVDTIEQQLYFVEKPQKSDIGRTGRAGKSGTALSFCTQEEYMMIKDIQKLTGKKLDTGLPTSQSSVSTGRTESGRLLPFSWSQ